MMKRLLLLLMQTCVVCHLSANRVLYQETHPDGETVYHGFWTANTGVWDWQNTKGLSLQCFSDGRQEEKVEVAFEAFNHVAGHAIIAFSGNGWHTLFVPWTRFDTNSAQLVAALRQVKSISVTDLNDSRHLKLRNVEAVDGEHISMRADVRGRSGKAGETVVYDFTITNISSERQVISLSIPTKGWEMMKAEIEPSVLTLDPNDKTICRLKVIIDGKLPAGNRERQMIVTTVNGIASSTDQIDFVTAVSLPAPNILLTQERWDDVRQKVKNYDWARKAQDNYIEKAEKWVVPEIATKLSGDNDQHGPHIFRTQEEHNLMAAAISYQLTGEKRFAEKVATFMRRLCDPERGYPKTWRGCSQSFVQEGHFFQHIAMAYDAVLPSGVFTKTDKQNVEITFRRFIDVVRLQEEQGAINNWKLSEMCGALYCALVLQDWSLAEELLYHPSMIIDHLSHGIMNDGFWYECSVGYNVWCATEFSQAALALEPWGEDLIHRRVPLGSTPWYSLMPDFKQGAGIYGMNFHKWGPVTKNSVCIKDMWDAIPRFADYRGVMFAVNDAQETLVAGESYELAYYLYRDPEYAAIIKRGKERNLLYGVPELPDVESELDKQSAFADNIGIVNLRSQTEGRPQREQIQAYMHYGTHGGYHGHFDRASFLGMMRYGRSFFNPEMVWYGYPSYMYKFYVQTSMDKNMVVVDDKMQLPRESFLKLFHTGEHMQAALVETVAPWAHPPYGGMKYDWAGGIGFQEKMWDEGRSIQESDDHPDYGDVTEQTEDITQRRLMIVTDDYVVLGDYLKGEKEHDFDNLLQMKGLQSISAKGMEELRHDGQMTTDCRSAAQFITDCQWWKTESPVKAHFLTGFGPDYDNEGNRCPFSEEGPLHINVISAWPKSAEVMIGTQPEPIHVQKQVEYVIKGDGQVLKEGKSGVWILGEQEIDVSVKNVRRLSLSVKVGESSRNTLFWANGVVITSDGKRISLKDLPQKNRNVLPIGQPGKDYYGGEVKIAGMTVKNAIEAEPIIADEESTIEFDLSQINAERLQVLLGGDFPLGDENPRRKTMAVRSHGADARFLTVIEPYEQNSVIDHVEASDADHLTVWLSDGRRQDIQILHIDKDSVKIILTETKDNRVVYKEETD